MTTFPPKPMLLSWLALLALLATTVFFAYQPLGAFNLAIALAVATLKALVVAAIFMELRESTGLIIAFALAGFFWLGVLIWLTGADIITRPQFPPVMPQ